MERRRYLQTAAGAAAAGLAGCGANPLGGPATTTNPYASPDTHLPAPDLDGPPSAYPWPVHGQSLPEATLPAPLADREVTTTEYDRPTLVTFFYTNCMTACPRIVSALRNVQARLGKNGESDAAQFLPITFDPARDDAAALEAYAARMNVDLSAGNWHFLRPADRERAKAVVTDTFGIRFERTTPEDVDQYMFAHRSIVVLANADDVVERAYRKFDWKTIHGDLTTVREA